MWCGFTDSYIIGSLFFETQCPVNGWKTVTVNVQCYLTLQREKGVICLQERNTLSVITFMQDGESSHTATPVKAFQEQTFEEDNIISKGYRFLWPPQSPDLIPADF